MVVTTIDGVYVAYDATTDVIIVTTVNGVDVAWQEAVAAGSPSPRTNISGPIFGSLSGPIALLICLYRLFDVC